MKKIIRLPGLIGFVALVTLIFAIAYFAAAPGIKAAIERFGSDAVGAKVEVGEVKLSFSPTTISFHRVKVADPDAPMTNLFEFNKAAASVDFLKLLMSQVVINDFSLHGLAFGTERKTSGAIAKKKKEEKPKEPSFVDKQLESIGAQLPDSDDILKREPLLIDERKDLFDRTLKEKEALWKELEGRLPKSDTFKSYEARLKQITDTKINSIQDYQRMEAELKQLKADIKKDKQAISAAKDELKNSKTVLKQQLTDLKNAPKEDWNRIKSKYSLDNQGLVNMSGLIFGPQVKQYTDQGLAWYIKLKPIFDKLREEDPEAAEKQRLHGRFIRFPEKKPTPDFWLKQSAITVDLPLGQFLAKVRDVTHQPDVINRPATLVINSTASDSMKSFDMKAVFDHRQGKSVDTADFTIDRYAVSSLKISGDSSFPLKLEKADANVKGQLQLLAGVLSGTIHGDFIDAHFVSGAKSGFAKELGLAVESIKTFDLDAGISGNLKDVDFDIKSDIDTRLKTAFNDRLDAKKKALEADINRKLQAKVNGYLKDADLGVLNDGENKLNSDLSNLDNMLKAKIDDYKEQEKKKAKDKLKNKLKDKFKGLF